jgi:copper transport protein
LPFGMALDTYGNVWFAQHVIDKIGVLDTLNGEIVEIPVPTRGTFVQWLAPDDQGRIWFAEQRGSSLGSINLVLNPASGLGKSQEMSKSGQVNGREDNIGTSSQPAANLSFEFGFADFLGPMIAGGIVIASFLYSRNVLEVKRIIGALEVDQNMQ